ncbi:hypothetical protein NPIL_199901 [Nephila pilipes]|uniref:C2H2-type domain-containing protein n=1 Tax=Nephila pilipes TaxID=299642 RepID=A0A8X6MWL1_NEPPI|nr:hypothetical protein NPIL_199901 [Nephila pilipes]
MLLIVHIKILWSNLIKWHLYLRSLNSGQRNNEEILETVDEYGKITYSDFDGSWIKESSDTSSSEQKNKRRLHYCTLCSYATSNKCHLKTHFRKHTGERPYLCKVCGKGYSSKQNLQSHEYLHAMQKLHTCEICKENFRNKSALEYHLTNQHQLS